MQVNTEKCKWFQTSVTYLGFLITRDEIKPELENVQGILNMQHPQTQKENPCQANQQLKIYKL
jgi:hypothetical protein